MSRMGCQKRLYFWYEQDPWAFLILFSGNKSGTNLCKHLYKENGLNALWNCKKNFHYVVYILQKIHRQHFLATCKHKKKFGPNFIVKIQAIFELATLIWPEIFQEGSFCCVPIKCNMHFIKSKEHDFRHKFKYLYIFT